MTDLTTITATELSALYQSGTVSPVTVVQQFLEKIAQFNPILNAFCFTDPDTTIKQAKASEQRWRRRQPLSAMDGVPVAIKDSILTQGWPTLHASLAVDPNQQWSGDAPCVALMRKSGAVFVGKTAMSEFSVSSTHSNSILYGNVYNPWCLDHTPGGSSGGSAVAVAANLVPLALGADFGASISVPSAFCGVFGMKPSTGRIPQYPSDVLALTAIGPMARTVQDLMLAMNIIARTDISDSMCLPDNNQDYSIHECDVSNLKIARVETLDGVSLSSEQSATVDKVEKWLYSQGATIELIDLDIKTANNFFIKLAGPKILHQWLSIPVDRRALTGRQMQHKSVVSHAKEDLYNQIVQRHQFIADTSKRMQSFDIILGPATIVSAMNVTAQTQQLSPLAEYFCVTKQPTITVPIGIDSNGVPQSVMIAGHYNDDIKILQVARAIEQQFPMPACPVIL